MKVKLLKKEVKPQWMVLYRHFGMPGGIFDYGEAEILGFFDNRKDAYEYAEKSLKEYKDEIEPIVWVLQCERTYQRTKEGLCYVYSKPKMNVRRREDK